MLEFDLYFVDFPCADEFLEIKDFDMNNLYCGLRAPFKYYSKDSTISVRFKSDDALQEVNTPRGIFKIFFQTGKHIWYTTNIYPAKLLQQKHTFHEIKHKKDNFCFISHRLQVIQLNISSCWLSSQVRIYDGSGVKSPQKSATTNVTSSAFIMLQAVMYTAQKS